MRTLNDYFLLGGNMSAIQTPNNGSDTAPVVPDRGRIISVFMNAAGIINDSATTFDIVKNNSDTGVDFTYPLTTAVYTGVACELTGVVQVEPGDILTVTSNGETNVASTAAFIWVIRR